MGRSRWIPWRRAVCDGSHCQRLAGVKGERNFPLAKYTRVKPGYCLLNQRNRSRPCGQTQPPHHKCLDTHAVHELCRGFCSFTERCLTITTFAESRILTRNTEVRTELLPFVFFELALALICLIRITPTCYSTAIIKRLRNTQVTWSPLCITCWILNSHPVFTLQWEKKGGSSWEGRGESGAEQGGGSNLSSIQQQKLLLPTIATTIQEFIWRAAVCHCRREMECVWAREAGWNSIHTSTRGW